jgi:alpha-1,2-mannosyltransferase
MAASQAELSRPAGEEPARRPVWPAVCIAAFAILTGLYVADLFAHPGLLNWFDLRIYLRAGRIARQAPGHLYIWVFDKRQFTYTPFAGLIFAQLVSLPRATLEYWVTAVSLVSVPVTSWLTFGALGWRGIRRLAAALALAGVALWLEPVQTALQLGQIELLLMLLIGWDLCQPDARRLKGAGVGLAAGIKLVPLIFIPYLLLAGKIRQAVTAAAAFVATALIGWASSPKTSASYWLTGYFMRPSGIGPVGGYRNQSLLALLIRLTGSIQVARPEWLLAAVITGLAGLGAAAMLHRSGRPVEGWVTCALTGLLVSPVSWDNHWVWLLPLLGVIVTWAIRATGGVRWAWYGVGIGVFVVFGAYPYTFHGPQGYVLDGGLLGIVSRKANRAHINDLHPGLLITWNLYILAGMALFVMMLITAWRARKQALAALRPGREPPAGERVQARTRSRKTRRQASSACRTSATGRRRVPMRAVMAVSTAATTRVPSTRRTSHHAGG